MTKPDDDFDFAGLYQKERRVREYPPPPPPPPDPWEQEYERKLAALTKQKVAERRDNWVTTVIWALLIGGGAVTGFSELNTQDYLVPCEVQDVCASYKLQRDACATAGSYKTCMSIKMGSENFSTAQNYCSESGSLLLPISHSLNVFTCSAARVKQWAKDLLK